MQDIVIEQLKQVFITPAICGQLRCFSFTIGLSLESIVGDIIPSDGVDPVEKSRLETEAMQSITNPLLYGDKVMYLWLEYDHGVTPRARVAKQLDKLDAGVMALVYEDLGFDVSELFPYAQRKLTDPALIHIFDTLVRREHDLANSHRFYFSLLAEARPIHDAYLS